MFLIERKLFLYKSAKEVTICNAEFLLLFEENTAVVIYRLYRMGCLLTDVPGATRDTMMGIF